MIGLTETNRPGPDAGIWNSVLVGRSRTAPVDLIGGAILGVLATAILTIYELIHRSGYSYPTGPNEIYAVSHFDEGVYTETGALMGHGYQLYSQIYSAQPPVLPAALSLADHVAGSGLVQTRFVMLGFGILALAGVFFAGAVSVNWLAGGVAAAVLALSPEFLVYSHAVEEEVPMMALSAASLALALGWRRTKAPELAAASGLFLGLGILTKFLAIGLLVPLALVLLLHLAQNRQRWVAVVRDAILFVGAAVLPLVLSLALWGQAEWTQMINDRLGATSEQGLFQQGSSIHLVRDFLAVDPAVAILTVIGILILLVWDWRTGVILASWPLATAAILMQYHPLFGHHLTVLLAPMALVAGCGLSSIFARPVEMDDSSGDGFRARRSDWLKSDDAGRRYLGVGLTALGFVLYLGLTPARAANYEHLLVSQSTTDRQLAQVARTVQLYTRKDDEVAAADPMICVLAGRPCVPEMVDTSYVRVETGKLTAAIAYTRRADTEVVVLGRALCLTSATHPYMAGYDAWVHAHYRLIEPVNIESGTRGQCPWRADNAVVRRHWRAGVYALGARGLLP